MLLSYTLCLTGLSRPHAEEEYQEDGEGDDYDGDDDYDDVAGPPPVMRSTAVNLVLDIGDVAFLPCDVEGNPSMYQLYFRFI